MKAKGESIIIKANGDAYIAAPKEVIVLVEKSKAKLAVKCANAPLMPNQRHERINFIHVSFAEIYFCRIDSSLTFSRSHKPLHTPI